MTAPVIVALLAAGACCAGAEERRLVYRLRGEVRPLLFWIGRDDVGGGHISLRRTEPALGRWSEEIEVLFGSVPERVPGRINRWGYGRETSEWTGDRDTPRLLACRFEGMMRHSSEQSLDEVQRQKAPATRIFDVTRSVVSAKSAFHEFRVFSDSDDFRYRSPDRLLAKYRETLTSTPPLRRAEISNAGQSWAEPSGFLTAVYRLIGDVLGGALRPSTTFVFNAKLYTLKVTRARRESPSRDVAILEFESFNTVKRTRSAFKLWIPTEGDLKGLPVRIALQPRWWLRLQLDLDRGAPRSQS